MTEEYGYEFLAREYYDSNHKTCRNFDETTQSALAERSITIPHEGLVLEVGCGKGRCTEFLGVETQRIVQLDSSREMLKLDDREPCCLRVLADATDVPLFDGQFAAVIGFLVDPFIGLNLFKEAFRLLNNKGVFFITTPTTEWGCQLRQELAMETSSARFITRENKEITVPSTLIPVDQLKDMLDHIGFKDIKITSHCLPEGVDPISPDISRVAAQKSIDVGDLPIIHLVLAVKS